MTPAALRRALLTSVAILLIAATGAAVVAPALGFRWDPFDRSRRRIEALEARLDQAERLATAALRLARAEADQAVRLDAHHNRVAQAQRVVADVAVHAQESPDAEHPLPADRAARLRDADRRLCALAPDLCAAADAVDPAGGGHGVVPPADPV